MYLHLGSERSTHSADIIGIFDMDTSTVTRPTNAFLTKAQDEGRLEFLSEENLPKSFVIAGAPVHRLRHGRAAAREARRDVQVIVSPLASATLKKRAEAASPQWSVISGQ